jgi:hypothetical protein
LSKLNGLYDSGIKQFLSLLNSVNNSVVVTELLFAACFIMVFLSALLFDSEDGGDVPPKK